MEEQRSRFLRILDRLEETLVSVLLAGATLVIFVAVTQRYGLSGIASVYRWSRAEDIPWLTDAARTLFFAIAYVRMTWAQELCIFMIVWMAKFGAAYGVRTGIHVGVDILVNRLVGTPRRVLVIAGMLAGALFTAVAGVLGAHLVWHIAGTGQISPDLEVPMWIVYLALPLGSFLMCYRFLEVAWQFWRTGELPHHDPGQVEGIEPASGAGGAR
ncbi:MAG TPA: TRAP transporter small permease [Hyphomicrobium sp.]|nr:TRAP transporter small permease [Hyphomicrobium sp.]